MKRLKFVLEPLALTSLIGKIRMVEYGGLDLQPKYQRNFIWKNEFKDKLIYSIVKDYPIGSIIIRQLDKPNEKGAELEIVDGQQRMTSIYEFIEGKYVIHSEFSRKIIEAMQEFYGEKEDAGFEKLKKKLKNKGKINLKYSDFPAVIKGKFEDFSISVTKIIESSDDEITEYFRFLQNQERLRAGEILHSLSNSKLDKYLLKIENIENVCSIIGFDNKRKEFDKIFYNIVGVLDEKISLGTPDQMINNYVTTVTDVEKSKDAVENIISQLNYISSKYNDEKLLLNTKKRLIKFMLLLIGFHLIDFSSETEKKMKSLEFIDNKLSVFFSTKPNVVKEKFDGYSEDVIEELRSIALISKGAQTYERVKNRMEILAYYISNPNEKQKKSGIEAK